jgi:hypothetical protein
MDAVRPWKPLARQMSGELIAGSRAAACHTRSSAKNRSRSRASSAAAARTASVIWHRYVTARPPADDPHELPFDNSGRIVAKPGIYDYGSMRPLVRPRTAVVPRLRALAACLAGERIRSRPYGRAERIPSRCMSGIKSSGLRALTRVNLTRYARLRRTAFYDPCTHLKVGRFGRERAITLSLDEQASSAAAEPLTVHFCLGAS